MVSRALQLDLVWVALVESAARPLLAELPKPRPRRRRLQRRGHRPRHASQRADWTSALHAALTNPREALEGDAPRFISQIIPRIELALQLAKSFDEAEAREAAQ